ncbi:uncharacterized protein CEXT_87221 [Caerostris extrusa]|uniref:Ig-like domain-containing protein n=1 Tax=Caerostris extrusa TaxID=172846 RepID=A0AAV4T867_CAEEX|nr:uncharacterized protein CEXT_87221 [Caerostris extrusa]
MPPTLPSTFLDAHGNAEVISFCYKNVIRGGTLKLKKKKLLPDENPKIVGSQPRYEVGDIVNVTMQRRTLEARGNLKWYINGKEADAGMERRHAPEEHLDGLSTSSLGLRFVVRPRDLREGGALTLRCTATVSQTYSTASEELVVGDRDPELLSSPPNPFSSRGVEGRPRDHGVGHSTAWGAAGRQLLLRQAAPAPELQWFLNDKQVEPEQVVRYDHPAGVLGLKLRVEARHLDENEEMRLKCTATLSRVINTRSQETTLGGNHRTSGLTVAENFGKVSERSSSTSISNSGGALTTPSGPPWCWWGACWWRPCFDPYEQRTPRVENQRAKNRRAGLSPGAESLLWSFIFCLCRTKDNCVMEQLAHGIFASLPDTAVRQESSLHRTTVSHS